MMSYFLILETTSSFVLPNKHADANLPLNPHITTSRSNDISAGPVR